MSWKVHDTDDVFAALRGLCSNGYRMYDPSEYRYYYDHDCETYECAVEDAAREYERLAEHCNHQREQLAKRSGSQTIDILMELLNEYQESECAIAEDRVTYYANRLDGRTEDERMEERTKTEQNGVGIAQELRNYARNYERMERLSAELLAIADRIDELYSVKVERLEKYRAAVDAMLKEYVKLPVDADGVPIHMGDSIEIIGGEEGTVVAIELCEGGWNVSMRPTGWDTPTLFDAESVRHVQPDTWERIIEDAISKSGWEQPKDYEIDYEDSKETRDRFVAELVERCRRLAGEAE